MAEETKKSLVSPRRSVKRGKMAALLCNKGLYPLDIFGVYVTFYSSFEEGRQYDLLHPTPSDNLVGTVTRCETV